jgi:Fe-S oxidoreductase
MVTFIAGEGFSVASGAPAAWRPVGRLVAGGAMGSLAAGQAHAGYAWMWWVHMVTVLGFTAYLPYSKHAHLLVSPFNVLFGNLRPAGDLGVVGPDEETSSGASRWDGLSWRQLLGPFACAECGRCDRACPAQNSGFPLAPQDLFRNLKHHLLDVAVDAGRSAAAPAAGDAAAAPADAAQAAKADEPKLIGGAIAEAALWSCYTCYACMERCAVMNEHIPLVVLLRRHLVSEGLVGEELQGVLESLNRYGNSFSQSERARAKWAQALTPRLKDARKEPVAYLWYVGDYASYDPRLQAVTQAAARVFRRAGLDVGLLYEDERNAGNDVRRVGEEGLFQMLREKNLQKMAKAKYEAIVTTDPHTYNTLKNEYALDGKPVFHYTELWDRQIREGKLALAKRVALRATLHDPCYLGRYNGIYGAPRRVLRALGVDLVEMPRHGPTSYCCGAGGGRIWMADAPGIQERPAESRVREAASLPGVTTLVVVCPKDLVMFQDALKTAGLEGKLAVKDLAELVEEALGPERSEADVASQRA